MINWIAKKHINTAVVNNLLQTSINTNHFTNYGPNVQLLEKKIREIFEIDKTKDVIVVNNGSVAIQALAEGISYFHKKTSKIKWATQSFTFPPSAQQNLQNIKIIDIDEDGGLDLKKVPENVNGLIITNIFGNIVDISKYEKWASEKKHRFLIFDNAATCYTFYKGKNCLNYGDGCSISFHHTKPFGFGEGGAIIVSKKYNETIRNLLNFGIGLTDSYYVKEGLNGKMSDISAVYIIQYLTDNFKKINNHHSKLYAYFKKEMKTHKIKHFKLYPSFHDNDHITAACLCLIFKKYDVNIMKKLQDKNITCRKYYHPLKNTKTTKKIYDNILCIPCNIDMDTQHIDDIINILNEK